MSLYLGFDVGTQGTKGLVIDLEAGRVLARSSRSYDLISGLAPGAAEQHPEQWWAALEGVAFELLAHEDVEPSAIAGIGVSGQQHGCVVLDGQRRVLRSAKLWCDTETAPQARELEERWGRSVPVGFTASKVLWLQQADPDCFGQIRSVLLPHDWINLELTGRLFTEAGDASGTAYFDPQARVYDHQALESLGIADKVPEVLDSQAIAGTLRDDLAERWGLRKGKVAVSTGGGDNMMSAIGSGATRAGVAVLSLGTSATVFAQTDAALLDPEGWIAPFCDSTGVWLPLLCSMNCTGVMESVLSAFPGQTHASLTALAGDLPAGSDGLMCLPYWSGERVPPLPEARGSWIGMRPEVTNASHFYRASLEGICFNLNLGVKRMRSLGMQLASLRVVGGGSKNPLWCQLLANISGVPTQVLKEPESAALGAALQVAHVHAERDYSVLTQDFVQTVGAEIEPVDVDIYQELYANFEREVRRSYPSVSLP